jgi:hypothetical protein
MVWYPKTKMVSPQFHLMFDDNLTLSKHPIQTSHKRILWTAYLKQTDINSMMIPLETNTHTYSLTGGRGVDIHPDNLTPTIETCQASFTETSPCDEHHSDTQNNASTKNTHNNTSIISMQDLVILHTNNIFPQSRNDDFRAYKHLHGIDMQLHSIPKTTKQKAEKIELSDIHDE